MNFLPHLLYTLWHRSPHWYMLPGGIFCLIFSDISTGYGIPFLMDRGYHTYLTIATSYAVLLATYLVTRHVSYWDLNQGIDVLNWCWYWPKYPEPTQALTKLFQQALVSDEISPTYVNLISIVSSCRRRSRSGAVIGPNLSKPQPNIFNRRRGSQYLCQVTSTLLVWRQWYSLLYPTEVAVPQIVSNCRHDLMNYFQLKTELSNPAPWTLRTRQKYWLLVVLQHACWRISSFTWSIDCFSSFCGNAAWETHLMLK